MKQTEEMTRETTTNIITMEREFIEKREKMKEASAEKLLLLKQQYNKEMDSKKLEFEKEKIKTEIELKAKYEKDNLENEVLLLYYIQRYLFTYQM